MELFEIGRTRIVLPIQAVLFAIPACLFLPLSALSAATLAFLLHETSHLVCAKRLGFSVSELKLLPFGASMRMEWERHDPNGEALVSLAGPVANLTAAACVALLLHFTADPFRPMITFLYANLCLGIWNLLPIFPMDGGRVLLSMLERSVSPAKARLWVGLVSVGMCVSLTAAAAYVGWKYAAFETLPIASVCVLLHTLLSLHLLNDRKAETVLQHRTRLYAGEALVIRPIVIRATQPLKKGFEQLRTGQYGMVYVLNSKNERIGTMDESELLTAIGKLGGTATFEDALKKKK